MVCAHIGQDKIGKQMENMMRNAFKRCRETEKLLGWSILESIFEMDQNWN